MRSPTLSRRRFLKLSALCGASVMGSALSPARTGCARQDERRYWQTTGPDVLALTSFDDVMKAFMVGRNIRSGALGVTRDGRLIMARGYTWSSDPNDLALPTSLFRIASLTKPITAVTVLKLVQNGWLSLDQRMVDILNPLPAAGHDVDLRLADVTIGHLLWHLGGWDSDSSFDPMFRDHVIARELGKSVPVTQADIIMYMTGQPLDFSPGERFAYSNYGYLLLGRIIEAITGTAYTGYVEENVFEPLGIRHMRQAHTLPRDRAPGEVWYYTQFTQPVPSVITPGQSATWPYGGWNIENMDSHGGWLGSAVDLARFVAALDAPGGHPVLNVDSLQAMTAAPPIGVSADGLYYGCGWIVQPTNNGSYNAWHTGSLDGLFALMVRRWDGMGWVALFNQRDDSSGLDYMDGIAGPLSQAADAVEHWPDHDLFTYYDQLS
ncbi:MAG: beta-lactamase family protein [Anaerolineae bacterium]|nr:beta-lactamase family protein [Anaerolineae bacterium]